LRLVSATRGTKTRHRARTNFGIDTNRQVIRLDTRKLGVLEIGTLKIREVEIGASEIGSHKVIRLKIVVTQVATGEVTSGVVDIRHGHRTITRSSELRRRRGCATCAQGEGTDEKRERANESGRH
jgi:hypothetical protein